MNVKTDERKLGLVRRAVRRQREFGSNDPQVADGLAIIEELAGDYDLLLNYVAEVNAVLSGKCTTLNRARLLVAAENILEAAGRRANEPAKGQLTLLLNKDDAYSVR